MSKFVKVEAKEMDSHFAKLGKDHGDIEPIIVEGDLVAVRLGKYRISATNKPGLTLHVDLAP